MNAVTLFVEPSGKDGEWFVALQPSAIAVREQALTVAAGVGLVRNPAENEAATEALRQLGEIRKETEATRKALKAPYLDKCCKIDATAKEFLAEVIAEESRIKRATADYQSEILAQQREAERIRRAEQERIEAERRREQEAIAEAKAKAEADAKRATNEAERQRLEAEAKAKEAELARSLANQQQELAALAPAPVAPRAAGQSAKVVWMHEVTDIWALARVHPGLVKIEPRKQEITEVINAQAMSGLKPQIAGLRIWEDVAVSVRGSKSKTLSI